MIAQSSWAIIIEDTWMLTLMGSILLLSGLGFIGAAIWLKRRQKRGKDERS